jgi:transcriptional regulator with XRE-family HTH domain
MPTGIIRKALRRELEQCGASLREVARLAGVSQPQLSRFLRGERGLSLEAADCLFAYFGLVVARRESDGREAHVNAGGTDRPRPAAAPAPTWKRARGRKGKGE